MPRSSRSIAYASSATSRGAIERSVSIASAPTHAVTSAEEPPRPLPGRRVGRDVDVDPRGHAHPLDRGLGQVHHAVVLGAAFEAVLDQVAEIQRPDPHLTVLPRREGDVRGVIDRGRQDGAAVALVVVGEVGAASDEADPKGRARADRLGRHGSASMGRVPAARPAARGAGRGGRLRPRTGRRGGAAARSGPPTRRSARRSSAPTRGRSAGCRRPSRTPGRAPPPPRRWGRTCPGRSRSRPLGPARCPEGRGRGEGFQVDPGDPILGHAQLPAGLVGLRRRPGGGPCAQDTVVPFVVEREQS